MDDLVPACGGNEPVALINGRRWQYCYHPTSGKHCYLDVDNDLITWNRSFHPAYTPELEGTQEPEIPTGLVQVCVLPGESGPLIISETRPPMVESFYF